MSAPFSALLVCVNRNGLSNSHVNSKLVQQKECSKSTDATCEYNLPGLLWKQSIFWPKVSVSAVNSYCCLRTKQKKHCILPVMNRSADYAFRVIAFYALDNCFDAERMLESDWDKMQGWNWYFCVVFGAADGDLAPSIYFISTIAS